MLNINSSKSLSLVYNKVVFLIKSGLILNDNSIEAVIKSFLFVSTNLDRFDSSTLAKRIIKKIRSNLVFKVVLNLKNQILGCVMIDKNITRMIARKGYKQIKLSTAKKYRLKALNNSELIKRSVFYEMYE